MTTTTTTQERTARTGFTTSRRDIDTQRKARPRLTDLVELADMALDEARFAIELGPLTTWLN